MTSLALLFVSWLLLRLEGKGLGAIGFDAPRRRLRELLAGLAFAAAFATMQQLCRAWVSGVSWHPNPSVGTTQALDHAAAWANAVFSEELAFRGYLFYQAIRRLGPWRASLLSAAAFGCYHWYADELFGDPWAMLWAMLLMGSFGLLFASAFVRTRSVAAPVGLHLGWNLASLVLFSSGPTAVETLGFAGLLVEIGIPLSFVAVGVTALSAGSPGAED